MDWIFPLIGGLGIGAILKSWIDFYLNKKSNGQKLKYEEMKEAYLGLLNSLHLAAVEPSEKASKDFAFWQTKVQLFGSNEVSIAVQGIIDTNEGPRQKRNEYFNDLIAAMKKDLSKV